MVKCQELRSVLSGHSKSTSKVSDRFCRSVLLFSILLSESQLAFRLHQYQVLAGRIS